MTDPRPPAPPAPAASPALIDERIVDSLDVVPRRLSKLSLFWYLKSLPELTLGTILTIIPVAIGAILSLILLIDWGIHRAFSNAQIEKAINYDFDTVDDQKLQEWIDSPGLADWINGLSDWVFVVPALVVLGLVVGWFVMRTLQWRRIRFGVEDGVIWMTGGLFAHWSRRLPITHVQSVEFRSTLLQRILTLRGVAISSAAPEGKHASIELLAVRRGVVAELAAMIETAFGATIATPDGDDDSKSQLIASVSWKSLIVAAANSFEVRLSIFALYVLYRLLGQVGKLKVWRDSAIHSVTGYAEQHHDLANIVLIVIGAILFFWIFSILTYIATFARFRLRRTGRLALIEHGLLTRRWRTVLLPRVQALTFVESPAQQLVNDGSLRITLPGTTRRSLERTMLLPAVDRTQAIDVLDRLFSEVAPGAGDVLRQLEGSLRRLPASARRSYLLRWVWRLIPVSLILCLVLYFIPDISAFWGLAPLVVLGPIGAILGNIRFKDAGWRLDERGRLAVRERALSRTTRLTTRPRIVWSRISMLRFFTAKNVTFLASVAGAGSRPGIKARILGSGLVARQDSRLRVRGLLDTEALDLVERLATHPATDSKQL